MRSAGISFYAMKTFKEQMDKEDEYLVAMVDENFQVVFMKLTPQMKLVQQMAQHQEGFWLTKCAILIERKIGPRILKHYLPRPGSMWPE